MRKIPKKFIPKVRNCKICGKEFLITGNLQIQKKTCSYECWRANNYAISKRICAAKITKNCKDCGKEFIGSKRRLGTLKCLNCIYKTYKQARIGIKNPNFKNGKYTHSNFQNRKSKVAYKHLNECRRYKKEFIEKYGYQFCELCGVNGNGTPKFEVHHIYFASKFPKHQFLHDNRNLIHLCLSCHHKFHAGKTYEKEFLRLELERGLKTLFQ